jgi:ATP-dependent Clp protease ATP-binding subunit ClpB
MEIVEVLSREGADWTIKDANDFLPEHCIDVSNGDDKKHEFKRLCEERSKKREEEDELKRAKELEEDQLKQAEKLEEDDQPKQSKKAEEEELKRAKKLAEDEELLKRRKRQSECFSSLLSSTTNCANTIFFFDIADEIEKIIGDKIIGQRGPIRSVASAIRLRENGWVDPDRPLVMLFLGSSGIGKTELAKQVTYYLNSNEDKTTDSPSLTEIEESGAFVRIDMSEYQHSHTVSNLTGTLSAS